MNLCPEYCGVWLAIWSLGITLHILASTCMAESHCNMLKETVLFWVPFSGAPQFPQATPVPVLSSWAEGGAAAIVLSSGGAHTPQESPFIPLQGLTLSLGLEVGVHSPSWVSESLHGLYLVWPHVVGSKLHQAGLWSILVIALSHAQTVLWKDRDDTGEDAEAQTGHLTPTWRGLPALSPGFPAAFGVQDNFFMSRNHMRDFPGHPVGKTLPSNAGDAGSIPEWFKQDPTCCGTT